MGGKRLWLFGKEKTFKLDNPCFCKMVDVNFSLGKRSFVWISLLVFFVGLGFVFAYSYAIPNSGHGGTGIFVSVNGNYLELQDAISGGEFSGNYVGGGNGVGLDHGHSASDVFVRVNGVDTPEIRTRNKYEKTLGYKARDYLRSLILDKIIILQ